VIFLAIDVFTNIFYTFLLANFVNETIYRVQNVMNVSTQCSTDQINFFGQFLIREYFFLKKLGHPKL